MFIYTIEVIARQEYGSPQKATIILSAPDKKAIREVLLDYFSDLYKETKDDWRYVKHTIIDINQPDGSVISSSRWQYTSEED